jgi:hypothetical protein
MKLVKMSLAAAMLMGVSAFADVKVSGDAQLYYGTADAGDDVNLFSKEGAYGQAAATLDIEAPVSGATAKLGMTYLTTMGLEDTLVAGIWAGDTLSDQIWVDELNFTFGLTEKTALIVGRQHLQTPLAFSETWSIVPNSMDAFVVANSDIPNTTLVAAYVARGNGAPGSIVDNTEDTTGDMNLAGHYNKYGSAIVENVSGVVYDVLMAATSGDAVASAAGQATFDASMARAEGGAYTVAAVTTAIPMTTAQLWLYDVVGIAQAVWLQADVNIQDMVSVGFQYGMMNPSDIVDESVTAAAGTDVEIDETTALAVKVAYTGVENLNVSAAYSMVGEGNSPVQMVNTATGVMGGAQSPLYTEAWWNYGYVGESGASSINLTAEYSVADVADFGLYATMVTMENEDHILAELGLVDKVENDMQEVTLTASKSVGALDVTLAYINTKSDDQNDEDAYNTVQAYLTYNF